METETKTRAVMTPTGRESVEVALLDGAPTTVVLTMPELQAIVQQAYDQHGILATPNMDTEVARIAEAHPGLCRCGVPGCSDGDTVLREFADRWGQSLRGRA